MATILLNDVKGLPKRIFKPTIVSPKKGDTLVFENDEWVNTSGAPKLSQLLVYYGYPISYKGINDVTQVSSEISSKFTHWVVGDSYQNPAHESYAQTVQIVANVRAAGVKVYGYVPIGQNTSNLSLAEIQINIDRWVTVGVDGIFLDEFGFDYGNTRTRQIDVVNYVHSKNLPYCANAWVVEDFACDDVSELTWPSNDYRYINFTTYNPTNAVLPRTPTSCYLVENFCFSHTGIVDVYDCQQRIEVVKSRAATKNFVVWSLAVFGETVPGFLDTTKLGSFKTLDDACAYVAANSFIFDLDIVGVGGYSFGSNGTPIDGNLPTAPDGSTSVQSFTTNYTTRTFTGNLGRAVITVVNTLSQQSVAVVSTAKSTKLEGNYPSNIVKEITVSAVAPTNQTPNQLWLDIS